jgi:hypothetical protein
MPFDPRELSTLDEAMRRFWARALTVLPAVENAS